MSESGKIIVGSVAVRVVPDATGFGANTDRQVTPEARALGKKLGEQFGRDLTRDIAPAIRDAVQDGTRTARTEGAKAGNDFGGSFATTTKARIEAAFKALPKAKVGTDATELDAELVAIRERLHALSDVRVGVDLDAGKALAEIEAVKERIASLAARSPHIDVKVDAARAITELAAVRAAVDAVGSGGGPQVGVGGLSSLSGLATGAEGIASGLSASTVAATALALALIPVAAVVAGLVGSAALLATILGGVVVAGVVGLLPIAKALQALSAADKQSAASATTSAAARVNAAEAVRSATAALANAQANADSAAIRSADAVKSARAGLTDAQRNASQAVTRALGAEASAEGALAAAQRSAKDATAALTQARKDAQQQLEDLARASKQGALDERQATLSIAEARQHLQEVQANPLATATDRQQAKLDYDQALQQLDDVSARNKTLATTKAQADAAGVNGAKSVLAAQQAVADATQRVADAQAAVVQSARDLSEARRAGAESVAKAEQAVTTALRAQTDQARQSAFSISQAQAAVASAGRAQQQALTATAGTAATADAALAGLSPTGRKFVTFLHDEFLPALGQVSRAATDGLAGGLTAGLRAVEPILPLVATGMGRLATAAGDFFGRAAKGLASPFWLDFFNWLTNLAGPAGKGASEILGSLVRGFAGLLKAFEPFAKQVAGGLKDLSEKFAAFGTSAGTGGSLDKFLNFLRDQGPGIAHDLGSVATAFADIVVAAAPLGVRILDSLGKFADFIHAIKPVLAPALLALDGALNPITQLSNAFKALKTVFSDVFDAIRRGWNALQFKLPTIDTHIPGVGKIGGVSFGVNQIPHLALGGIVTSPTLALIGEGRGPEAVIPLARMAEMAALFSSQRQQVSSGDSAGSGRSITVNQTINNPLPERPSETAATTTRRLEHFLS